MKNKQFKYFILGLVLSAAMVFGTGTGVVRAADEEAMQKIGGIGSVSKMYVTVAAMQLYDQGKLDLDEPVVTYVPDFRMADARYKDITVRMLMNHSSGFMGTTNYSKLFAYDNQNTEYHDEFLDLLAKQSLKADPGSYSAYCNDGFILLELVVENVSGENFTDYISKHINAPLGLTQTGTPISAFRRENMVSVYSGKAEIEPEYCGTIGCGGVLSTAAELAQFGKSFFTGNTSLLSEKAKKEMNKTSATDPYEDQYGLGWDSINQKEYQEAGVQVVTKGGDCLTQHAGLCVAPDEKISVAVVSSNGSSMFNELMGQQLMNIVLEERGIHVQETTPQTVETIDTVPDRYKEYEGYYIFNGDYCKITFPEMKCMRVENLDEVKKTITDYKYTDKETFVLMEGNVLKGSKNQDPSQTELHFVKENGKIFLKMDTVIDYVNVGSMEYKSYTAEKIEDFGMDRKLVETWKQREGKYYLATGRYYECGFSMMPSIELTVIDDIPGYIYCYRPMKITDNNSADKFGSIPGQSGRDWMNLIYGGGGNRFLGDHSIWFVGQDMGFIPEDSIPVLSSTKLEVETKENQPMWYILGEEIVNQTISIERTEKTSVYILDEFDQVVYSSYMKDYGTNIPLPEKGKLVVVGDDGEHVSITVE